MSLAIVLFRNDLRILDNPALTEAIEFGANWLLPVYVFDRRQYNLTGLNKGWSEPRTWDFKLPRCLAPRQRFRVEAVRDLRSRLRDRKSDLMVRYGEPYRIMAELVMYCKKTYTSIDLYMNHEIAHEEVQMENEIRKACSDHATVHFVDQGADSLLHPHDVPFKTCPTVYTDFRKLVEGMDQMVRPPIGFQNNLQQFPFMDSFMIEQRDDLTHLVYPDSVPPSHPSPIPFQGGETAALERVQYYLFKSKNVTRYKDTRNEMLGTEYSTKFSPFLAHGCISARTICARLKDFEEQCMGGKSNVSTYWVRFELLWRDFFRFRMRSVGNQIFKLHGDCKRLTQWKTDTTTFAAWRHGQTGVPFIDANMREIAQTGYMSNRGRQNVASFLTRDLELIGEWAPNTLRAY